MSARVTLEFHDDGSYTIKRRPRKGAKYVTDNKPAGKVFEIRVSGGSDMTVTHRVVIGPAEAVFQDLREWVS